MPAFDRWDPLAVWLWLTVAYRARSGWRSASPSRGASPPGPRSPTRPFFVDHARRLGRALLSLAVERLGWGVLNAGPPGCSVLGHSGEVCRCSLLPGETTAWVA